MTGAEGINFVTVRIDVEKCVMCYTCLAHCPTDALRLDKGHFVHNAYECAYDEVCQDVCPNNALTILEM